MTYKTVGGIPGSPRLFHIQPSLTMLFSQMPLDR